MADAEADGELVIPGRLTRFDGALQGEAVAAAEGLEYVPDEAYRRFRRRLRLLQFRRAHGGNPRSRIVSSASGSFMLIPSGVLRQPG